jgi:flagellar assembly protein FliH
LTKAVFRLGEIAMSNSSIVLDAPFRDESKQNGETPDVEINTEDVFQGPTADELRAEAELFKVQWENEKTAMINAAKAQAEMLVNDARFQAEEKIKITEADIDKKIEEALLHTENIKQEAQASAQAVINSAQLNVEEIKEGAHKEGFETGRSEGYEAGKTEVQRLIERTHLVLERIQDKRSAILSEVEQQIIDLTLLIARKVIKTISETEKTVVIENIKAALKKIKTRGNITVKVNLADLQLSTDHVQEFTRMLENNGTIEILEDSSIEPGGCIIETDFGAIDARITSQLAELETKILSLSPIKGGA